MLEPKKPCIFISKSCLNVMEQTKKVGKWQVVTEGGASLGCMV
jgi:hypothetical protein